MYCMTRGAALGRIGAASAAGLVLGPWACATGQLELVSVDYLGSAAATDKNTWPEAFPLVEWTEERQVPAVVYRRASDTTIEFVLRNPTDDDSFGWFSLEDPRLVLPDGSTVQLSPAFQEVAIYVPAQGEGSATVTVRGVPNHVLRGSFRAIYEVNVELGSNGPGKAPSYMPTLGYYLTDNWPTGVMSTVWTDVLDYSCGLAQFQDGFDAVTKEITKGLWQLGFLNDGMQYEPTAGPQFALIDVFSPARGFRLRKFLLLPERLGDCNDFAHFLEILFESQGYQAACPKLRALTFDGTFLTAALWPSGQQYVAQYFFAYHLVTRPASANVFDAACAQSVDVTDPMHPPPGGWVLASDWPLMDYWQFEHWFTGQAGLVYGYVPGVPVNVPLRTPPPEYSLTFLSPILE